MKKLPITNRKKFNCTYNIPSKNLEIFAFNYLNYTVHFHRNDTSTEGICVEWKDNPFKLEQNKPYIRIK